MKEVQLPENPTEEQATKIGKVLVKRILEEFYTEGIHDLTATYGDNPLVEGQFVAKRRNTKGDRPLFSYTISPSGDGYVAEYLAVSGVDDEGDTEMQEGPEEDLDRILTRVEEMEFSESFFSTLEEVREKGTEGIDAYLYSEYLVDLQDGFEAELQNLLESDDFGEIEELEEY
jgi:hypothetical protein